MILFIASNLITLNNNMNIVRFCSFLVLAGIAPFATGQVISFQGQIQAGTPVGYVWGTIDSAEFTATASDGFASLSATGDVTLFGGSFGGLEAIGGTSSNPIYTDSDSSGTDFQLSYNGVQWATGEVLQLELNMIDAEGNATATGLAKFTAAGTNSAFFNELMTLTSGSGLMAFAVEPFYAFADDGVFTVTGTLSAVPEPGTYAAIVGFAGLGFALLRRKIRARPAA